MRRLFITGEILDSEYANEVGLVDFIASEEEIDEIISNYIEVLRSSGPNAIKEVKKLINKCEKMDVDSYKEHTVEKISELRVSDEGQEGIKAFLEKRKPKWGD
jgi:methylglutaconyl-CoA hydratase